MVYMQKMYMRLPVLSVLLKSFFSCFFLFCHHTIKNFRFFLFYEKDENSGWKRGFLSKYISLTISTFRHSFEIRSLKSHLLKAHVRKKWLFCWRNPSIKAHVLKHYHTHIGKKGILSKNNVENIFFITVTYGGSKTHGRVGGNKETQTFGGYSNLQVAKNTELDKMVWHFIVSMRRRGANLCPQKKRE